MGTEYRITFEELPERAALDGVLRAQPRFADFDAAWGSYNFRLHGAAPAMPHAEARIDDDGVYFCDYADDGSIFTALQAALSARWAIAVRALE